MSSSRDDVRDGEPSDRDILSTRTFDAPRERVFEAFSDPARLARWWGPLLTPTGAVRRETPSAPTF